MKKKIHRTWQRTDGVWDTREEVATMTLEVLSLGCGDMRRLNWNVLEEEKVILGSGETLTYEFVEMVGHRGRNV